MYVRLEAKEDTIIAYLEGELDHHAAKDIRQAIDDAVTRQKPQRLVLDFQNVSFMDSSGIGLVMGRYRLLHSYNAELLVANTSPQITKVMKLAGLDRLAELQGRSMKQ